MNKTYLEIILVSISLVLLITGVILMKQETTDTNINNQEIIELNKEKCTKEVCMSNLKIQKVNSKQVYLTASLVNKTTEKELNSFINLVFSVDNKKYTEVCYYKFTKDLSEITIEMDILNNKFLNAKDYYIEKPSDDQLREYYSKYLGLHTS